MVRRLPELQDFDGLLRRSERLRKSDAGDTPTVPRRERNGNGAVQQAMNGDGANSGGGNARKPDPERKTRAKRQRARNNQGPRVAF